MLSTVIFSFAWIMAIKCSAMVWACLAKQAPWRYFSVRRKNRFTVRAAIAVWLFPIPYSEKNQPTAVAKNCSLSLK